MHFHLTFRRLEFLPSYFLFIFYAITPLLIFALHSVWTLFLTFLLWHSNCIPSSFSFMIHFEFCVTFSCCIISVSEGSATIPWLLLSFFSSSANLACPFPPIAFLSPCLCAFPVCQPDCLRSCLLLLHVCEPCWWLQLDPSNGRHWLCSHLANVRVNKCACKHAADLLRLRAPRLEQLWCSFGSTSGSGLIREPLDWRTQSRPSRAGKEEEGEWGVEPE